MRRYPSTLARERIAELEERLAILFSDRRRFPEPESGIEREVAHIEQELLQGWSTTGLAAAIGAWLRFAYETTRLPQIFRLGGRVAPTLKAP